MSDIKSYDSFAKLNIMSEVHSDKSKNIPQIMIGLTDKDNTWKGDRLTINYSSGNDAGYFTISEVTGSYRNKLNFEIIGSNNIFQNSVKGAANNSFIYSKNNSISHYDYNTNFINSDANRIQISGTKNINFINSNDNKFIKGKIEKYYSSATDISLYNSNKNRFIPRFDYIKGKKDGYYKANFDIAGNLVDYSAINATTSSLKGGVLKNKTLIDSHNNRFVGYNDSKTTLINTHNSYQLDLTGSKNNIFIGGNWNYIKGCSGNTIGIGQGLINQFTDSDKIILGQYNKNSTNPNEILIVGDGFLNENYLNKLKEDNPEWETNDYSYGKIIEKISGNGSPLLNSDLYRHNIFTVNKEGYITISDWQNPSNSARYGYNGLTAYENDAVYDIPYKTLYNKINVGDAVSQMQETLDSYTMQMNDIIDTTPINITYSIEKNKKEIYLNYKPSSAESTASAEIWDNISTYMNNNTLFGITFEGASIDDEVTLYWCEKNKIAQSTATVPPTDERYSATYCHIKTDTINYKPIKASFSLSSNQEWITTNFTKLKPYCYKQFLYINNDNFIGFTPVLD